MYTECGANRGIAWAKTITSLPGWMDGRPDDQINRCVPCLTDEESMIKMSLNDSI